MTTRELDALLALVRPEIRAIHAYKTPLDPLPVKLDANESPFSLPPEVTEDLGRVAAGLALERYPDLEVRALREALAGWIGTSPSRLVVGVGSDESIAVLLTALARPRDREAPVVVLPDPTFVMYAQTARVLGVEPVSVPLVGRDFALDVERTIDTIRAHRAACTFLASPNNPTGVVYDDAALLTIAEACPTTWVVVDEAYGAYRARSHRAALVPHTRERAPNLVFMGTLSKIGLAALRIGWLEAPEPLAHELDKVRLPYNMPAPSQALGARLLTVHRAVLEARIADVVRERVRVIGAIGALHRDRGWIRAVPTEANFVLCELRSDAIARAAHAHLASCGIQVRAFSRAPLDRHLRITFGRPEENTALLEAFSSFAPDATGPR
ncbi:MAG: histidinol-phosphate transaminase [Sandaracinaceae bacterium]